MYQSSSVTWNEFDPTSNLLTQGRYKTKKFSSYCRVLRVCQKDKVLRAIVKFVPVYMMDVLIFFQRASEPSLHNQAVFPNSAPVEIDDSVAYSVHAAQGVSLRAHTSVEPTTTIRELCSQMARAAFAYTRTRHEVQLNTDIAMIATSRR